MNGRPKEGALSLELTPSVRAAMLQHVVASAPGQCFGLLVHNGERLIYYFAENFCDGEPGEQWMSIAPGARQILDRLGRVTAVIHGYPGTNEMPSNLDRIASTASALPWLIVSAASRSIKRLDPDGSTTDLPQEAGQAAT